eukprot:CAMPEP_0175170342 /NCGR_PEP_ID=MMETSP0087-20121206/30154_1 /TAXON_ID=136419 /ORGANISM="Unknown Unknown, Strain D1" /LENGTH=139 /DNA_ID=CAMNT_0016460951 /DNA_START=159 /DNA_END=578 /DNA_ORIENTATION=+
MFKWSAVVSDTDSKQQKFDSLSHVAGDAAQTSPTKSNIKELVDQVVPIAVEKAMAAFQQTIEEHDLSLDNLDQDAAEFSDLFEKIEERMAKVCPSAQTAKRKATDAEERISALEEEVGKLRQATKKMKKSLRNVNVPNE